MAAYVRQWRKRQRALEEYLRESESDVLPGLENPPDNEDMPGTPNSSPIASGTLNGTVSDF